MGACAAWLLMRLQLACGEEVRAGGRLISAQYGSRAARPEARADRLRLECRVGLRQVERHLGARDRLLTHARLKLAEGPARDAVLAAHALHQRHAHVEQLRR
eukprot:CAMPEP_0180061514 /NCGR_PEP_ID=MMETSP0985-20121206/6625_1 /TAXON_ID=483367 /ORGANISM="non described non described, Strain CCMP 2436" /LENGTH=101 /DNA_ID=CAMNT_0021991627 /DNA_START=318 /DNA_END=618 /DNA_ORIENTATION=-